MFRKLMLALALCFATAVPAPSQGHQAAVTTRAAKGTPLTFAEGDANWTSLQAGVNAANQQFGKNEATTTGLTWGYFGATYWSGTAWVQVADGTLALTASASNYVERTEAGVVSSNTAGFTSTKYPIAKVITGTSTILSWTDYRAPISTVTRSESGATTRALTDKVKDVVSVKDFGAVGDGSANDTTPINNALATGKSVYFPGTASFYKVDATLVLNSNQTIYGDGHTSTLIENRTNSQPILKVVNAGSGRTLRYLIRDLGFYSNTLNTTRVLDLRGSSYFKLENVQVIGDYLSATKIGGVGIDITTDTTSDQNQFGAFNNVYVSYCDYGLRGKMNTLNITGGSFAANTHYGIALITGQQSGVGRSFKSLGVTLTNVDLSGNHNGSTNSNIAIVLPGASISAVAGTNVYHRAAGSWTTDGFVNGQEVRVYGFPTNAQNNGVAVVTNVTASDLTVDKTLISEGPWTTVTVKTGNYGGGAWIIGDGIHISGGYHESNGGRISGLYTPNDIEIDPLSTGITVVNERWDYDHTKGKVSGDQEDVGEQFGSGPGTNQTGTYNLVPNGNFDNLDATSTPLGWIDSGTGTWSAVPDPSTIPGGHGNGARITLGAGTPRMYHTIFDSTGIAKNAGRWVVMTGYIRANVSGGGALARAGFATGAGGAISSSLDAYVAAELAPANTWVKYTMRYQIKGTETTLSAVPYLATGTGTVDIAGISVSLGETAWGNAEAPITSGGGDVWSQTFTLGGSKMGWGTAVPTSGTWAVGDRVFNTSATSGASIFAWVCVGAGTPGTWRAVGGVSSDSTDPFRTTYTFDSTSNAIFIGSDLASSGNGGSVRLRDDTGTQRWLSGLLGTGGATAWTLYNLAHSRTDATVADATGLWNFPVTPTTATAAVDDNSTQVATTAFLQGQKGTATPIVDGTGAAGSSTKWAPIDHVHPTDTSRLAVSASANPTASVGTTAVNGSASTYMRSDAAPALDVSISPTWTGAHTFQTGITIFGLGTSTNGGRIKFKNDAGTLGWQVGYLGTASATALNIYDLANSRAVLALTTGATGTATWTSTKNIFSASVAGQAGVNITPGVAPTSPVNGDVWQDSTSFAMTYRANGASQIILSTADQRTTSTSSAPAGTTSTTAVMMAIGGAITPAHTTKVLVIVSGQMANSTINDGAAVQLRFGTGTAPTNGAAVTGTQIGVTQTHTSLVAADTSGWCISGVATVTAGTAYWFDIALNAVTGGTATATGVSISLVEL